MEPRTYFVHSAQRYGCLTVALAALSCGSASHSSGGAGGGGGSGGGASGHGGTANAGHAGTGGKGGTTNASDAGTAGAPEANAGTATVGGAEAAGSSGSSGSGGANSSGAGGASSGGAQGGGAGDAPVPANDLCPSATVIPLGAAQSVDIMATTLGAHHDVDAPCESGAGPDVFYQFDVSKRVFVYADTFDASWDTVLYLLTNDCTPIAAPTTTGDAVCNSGACGTSQSRIVALLDAGRYRLGLSGRAGAAGTAKIHFEFALAGNGSVAPLPMGSTVQSGSTVGASGGIQSISPQCIAAGPENSYWWSGCPSDPGGSLSASTCDSAQWENVLELQLPASAPYTCSLDSCGVRASLSSTIPAGAGLRVLSVDGDAGTDKGAYTMTVSRP